MTQNPILNALSAAVYIVLIGNFLYFGAPHLIPIDDSVLAPITFLSLLTLSIAFMAYTFFGQPACLCLEGKAAEGLKLGFQTVGAFAAVVAVAFVVLLALSNYS